MPIGSRDDYIRLSQHPDLWHPIRGPKLVLTYASARLLRPLYDQLVANYVPGETVFCAHVMDLASRVAGEKLRAPVARVVFAPGVLWTVHDSPRLKGALLGPRVPRWLKRLQFWTADTLFVQPILGPRAESHCAASSACAGATDFFALAAYDPTWCSACFPIGSARRNPIGRRKRGSLAFRCGIRRLRDTNRCCSNDEVREFLAAGPPPIAFSPGSANREAHMRSSPRPSKRASGSASAAFCSPSTIINCRPSFRRRCDTSASCR